MFTAMLQTKAAVSTWCQSFTLQYCPESLIHSVYYKSNPPTTQI